MKVVIIGGGIVGASIAYHLAARGQKEIVILDKSKAGSGSTAASLGGFRHQFSNELSVKLSLESVDELAHFEERMGYDPLIRRDGYLFIASSEKSLKELEENRRVQKSLGVDVDLLSKEDLKSRFRFYKFDTIIGGTLCLQDGHASTFAVHQGYLSKAKQLGVKLYEEHQVTKIERDRDQIKVNTLNGRVFLCDQLVIAAGAFSGLVGELSSISIPILPYPRKILVTHPFLDGIPAEIPLIVDVDSTLAIGREGRGVIMSNNHPTSSNYELVFDEGLDDSIISSAVSRVPTLAKSSIAYSVKGLYEMTPDANPIVSQVSENIYCCAGFAGHGFMHSPAIGTIMSELILSEKPHLDIGAYDIHRFDRGNNQKEGLII